METKFPQPAPNPNARASFPRLDVIGWQLIIHMTEAQTAELVGWWREMEMWLVWLKGGNAIEAIWFKVEDANETRCSIDIWIQIEGINSFYHRLQPLWGSRVPNNCLLLTLTHKHTHTQAYINYNLNYIPSHPASLCMHCLLQCFTWILPVAAPSLLLSSSFLSAMHDK